MKNLSSDKVSHPTSKKITHHTLKKVLPLNRRLNLRDDGNHIIQRRVESGNKFSQLKYLKINIDKPLKIKLSSIQDISIESIVVNDYSIFRSGKALLINVSTRDENHNIYLVNIDELLNDKDLNKKEDSYGVDGHFENLFHSLTQREQGVLIQVANGLTSSEIAANLYISPNTVKNHRKNIKKKLCLKSNLHYSRFLMWSTLYCERA